MTYTKSTHFAILLILILFWATFSFAMDHSTHDHSKMKHETKSMDHGNMMGEMIHQSTSEGYAIMYHLIDMTAHMKDMPEMKASHHLMMYITDPAGNTVNDAKVGYLLTGPDKATQKVMAMKMAGGFGGDINLMNKGVYTIKAKAVVGTQKILDEFQYPVK